MFKNVTHAQNRIRLHVKYLIKSILIQEYHPLDETHLDAVRGLTQLRGFHPSASTSGDSPSDAATSSKDKQICLSTLLRTGFDTEVCSYLAFHS